MCTVNEGAGLVGRRAVPLRPQEQILESQATSCDRSSWPTEPRCCCQKEAVAPPWPSAGLLSLSVVPAGPSARHTGPGAQPSFLHTYCRVF